MSHMSDLAQKEFSTDEVTIQVPEIEIFLSTHFFVAKQRYLHYKTIRYKRNWMYLEINIPDIQFILLGCWLTWYTKSFLGGCSSAWCYISVNNSLKICPAPVYFEVGRTVGFCRTQPRTSLISCNIGLVIGYLSGSLFTICGDCK